MPTLAIQPGTTIFVTGANGLIGSHVIEQLLKMGYNVRGAVRSVGKCQWLADYFRNTNESVKLELVEVPDMTVDGCYDEAVQGKSSARSPPPSHTLTTCQGTAGIVHIASPLNGEDPNVAIPIAVNVGLNALKAAAKTPSITRVVYTSSSLAATYPSNGVKKVLDQHSYNEEGIRKGWKHPEDEPESHKSLNIYAALKAEAEKACWKWVEENRPDFVFNSIVSLNLLSFYGTADMCPKLPNVNFSKVLVPEHQGTPSTIAWGKAAFTVENFAHYAKVITPRESSQSYPSCPSLTRFPTLRVLHLHPRLRPPPHLRPPL
jgi:nucleoside-diphosphate-sugar epimerase